LSRPDRGRWTLPVQTICLEKYAKYSVGVHSKENAQDRRMMRDKQEEGWLAFQSGTHFCIMRERARIEEDGRYGTENRNAPNGIDPVRDAPA
jgi:hypothetical protein